MVRELELELLGLRASLLLVQRQALEVLVQHQALVLPELQALHLVDLESDQPYGFLYQVMY